MNTRTSISITVVAICCLLQACGLKEIGINAQLMAAASNLNKTCPLTVDKETRLDNAVVLPGKVFQYNYTLINVSKSAVDTTALKNAIAPHIVNTVKTSPDMKFFRDNKVTMAYNYADKNGAYILKVLATPELYLH